LPLGLTKKVLFEHANQIISFFCALAALRLKISTLPELYFGHRSFGPDD